jgi:glutathione synthase/RimK-type ligase-like ATP-grasp enzyme
MRIALVTHAERPELTADDRHVVDALARRGVTAVAAAWDADTIDWCSFDLVVLRSCWNYHRALVRFERWIRSVERAGVRLVNCPETIRWNVDKRYLLDLAERGVRIPATILLDSTPARRDRERLVEFAAGRDVVVKPTVGATAFLTERVAAGDIATLERAVSAVRDHSCVLVQEYLTELGDDGEWSLVFFDGVFSHAVVKRPATGDFRSQEEYGGHTSSATPPPALVHDAHTVLKHAGLRPTYARVDAVYGADGFVLMELELVEPSLFLVYAAESADRFAQAILRAAGATSQWTELENPGSL